MSYEYSNPKRATDPHALPNVEVFYLSASAAREYFNADEDDDLHGWYWQACSPGWLPDSEPNGPFATADAQENDGDIE